MCCRRCSGVVQLGALGVVMVTTVRFVDQRVADAGFGAGAAERKGLQVLEKLENGWICFLLVSPLALPDGDEGVAALPDVVGSLTGAFVDFIYGVVD